MKKEPLVFILNGPNLSMLGVRELSRYGKQTMWDLEQLCLKEAANLGLRIDFRQTVHEGTLVEWIQESHTSAMGVILNAGGYARTSFVIPSAIRAVKTPVVEVHITNIAHRDASHPHSLLSAATRGTIFGFGLDSYVLALHALHRLYV